MCGFLHISNKMFNENLHLIVHHAMYSERGYENAQT